MKCSLHRMLWALANSSRIISKHIRHYLNVYNTIEKCGLRFRELMKWEKDEKDILIESQKFTSKIPLIWFYNE